MNDGITTLWIDESGDCGFKFDKGSSRFLVIVAVYTNSDEDAIVKAIEMLKAQQGLDGLFEFKFSRCRNRLKESCLRVIASLPLSYKAIVVDKKDLNAPGLQFHPHELYCEAVRRLFYDNDPPLKEAVLILDEATMKIHAKEFQGTLKKYLSKNIVSKIRQVRSTSNLMVQIADMVAGSIFRAHEKGDDQWYQMIRHKEKIIITF